MSKSYNNVAFACINSIDGILQITNFHNYNWHRQKVLNMVNL